MIDGSEPVIPVHCVQLFLESFVSLFSCINLASGVTATSNREPDRTQLENVFRVGRCRVGTQVIQCKPLDGRRCSICDDPARREARSSLTRTDPYQETTNPRTRLAWANDRRLGPVATPRGVGHSTGIMASAPRGARAAILAN